MKTPNFVLQWLIAGFAVGFPGAVLAQSDSSVSGGEREKGTPSEVTISDQAKRMGFNVKRLAVIDRKLGALVRAEKIIGCSAMIYRNGEEIYSGTWGFQDLKKKTPVTRDSIFRIYSMSKPITSVAAMQLVEQGKMDLDDPVGKYLPELSDLNVLSRRNGESVETAARRSMTIRDLLRHTSGLTYGLFGNTEVDQRYKRSGILITDFNLESTVKKLGKIPLLNDPGSKFHYSVSTDVLGRVVEVVSGQAFDEYLKEHVFDPLGMEDTFFTVPVEKQDRFAQLYRPNGNQKLAPANPIQSFRFYNQANKYFSGGGGLCSCVNDYRQFCEMLLNEGELNGNRILKKETVDLMFTNQLVKIDNPPWRQFKFGLGFRVFPKGDFGWGGAAGTRFWVNPEKDTVVIFMTQIMPYGSRKHGDIVRSAAYSALR